MKIKHERLISSQTHGDTENNNVINQLHLDLNLVLNLGTKVVNPRLPPSLRDSVVKSVSKPSLDSSRQSPKIRNSLQLIIRKLDPKMMFQPRKQIQRLQAIYPQALKKIIIRRKILPRHFELCRCQIQNLIHNLFLSSRCHKSPSQIKAVILPRLVIPSGAKDLCTTT